MTSATEKGTDIYTLSLDCVHCGLCLPACPTYQVLGLETDSPRGRLYLMRALQEGRIEDPQTVRLHLDQCLGCRGCEAACPSGVEYGRILDLQRSELEEKYPAKGVGASLRRFLLNRVIAYQGRLRLAFRFLRTAQILGLHRIAAALRLLPSAAVLLMPKIPAARHRRPLTGSFEPEGIPRARVTLFTGCVMEQLFGDINRRTLQLLLANGFAVDIPSTQGCCGALHRHDGQTLTAQRLARKNMAAFADAEIIINNSAGCGAALKEYGELLGDDQARAFATRCRDVTEFLAEQGLTAEPAPFPHRVAYDDPCHLCHGQGLRAQPRELLAAVPELQLVPHPNPESCCGAAGIYNLVHQDLAQQIGQRKLTDLASSEAEVVVTGNPGCMMQIDAHRRAAGSEIRVMHPVDLLLPEEDSG